MLPDFKIVLRPNNQISITRQNVIKKRERYENIPPLDKLPKRCIESYVHRRADHEGLKTSYSKVLRRDQLDCGDRYSLPIPSLPLDLINRFQHDKNKTKETKKGYGTKPSIKYFSHKSGQKVRETGAIIDRLCGQEIERCRVVTLTLPSSERYAFDALSCYSGYATNRLFQIVRRDWQLAHWFYVWEHQKRGALHLHICVYHDDPSVSELIGTRLCEKWVEILRDIGKKRGIDMLFSRGFNRTCEPHEIQLDNQAMRLGCGAYFSKYASKNSGKSRNDINSVNARKYPPSSFWGRSRELAKMCEMESFKFSFEGIIDEDADAYESEALRLLSHSKIVLSHSFAFKKEIELPKENGNGTLTICEGYTQVFYVNPRDYQMLLAHYRHLYRDDRTSNIIERSKISTVKDTMFHDKPDENEFF